MLYNNLISSRINNSRYNLDINLRFLFEIMIFDIFQSFISSRFKNVLIHSIAN